jgi:hypothetical protein
MPQSIPKGLNREIALPRPTDEITRLRIRSSAALIVQSARPRFRDPTARGHADCLRLVESHPPRCSTRER